MKQKNMASMIFTSALFIYCSTINAYIITINNQSLSTVNVYISQSVCSPIKDIKIAAGQTETIQSDVCCSEYAIITALDGGAKGKIVYFYPPKTGLGMSCLDYGFTITQTSDNRLAVRSESPPKK